MVRLLLEVSLASVVLLVVGMAVPTNTVFGSICIFEVVVGRGRSAGTVVEMCKGAKLLISRVLEEDNTVFSLDDGGGMG